MSGWAPSGTAPSGTSPTDFYGPPAILASGTHPAGTLVEVPWGGTGALGAAPSGGGRVVGNRLAGADIGKRLAG